MLNSLINPFVNNNTTSAAQAVGPVYLNAFTTAANLGVGNINAAVYPNGTVPLPPGTYLGGSYGVGTIGYAPAMPTTGVVEVTITNGKGATETVWAMMDCSGSVTRVNVFTNTDFSRVDGGDLSIVGDGDVSDGIEQEDEEQAPHFGWSHHY